MENLKSVVIAAREIEEGEVDQGVEACPFVRIVVTKTKTKMVGGREEDGAPATRETETETLKAEA